MYKTKVEFLAALEKELTRAGITDRSEIIADFELHFADSTAQNLSEAEICAKLGSISEIAKQYAEDEIYPVVAVEAPPVGGDDSVAPKNGQNVGAGSARPQDEAYAEYENSGIKLNFGSFKKDFQDKNFNAGGLVTCILIDIFVLSWAIPALFAVCIGLLAVPFALIVSGLTVMLGGLIGNGFFGFFSPHPGLVTFFAGLFVFSLGGLFSLLGVQLVRLFIKVLKAVIDWHGNMIVGRPVFSKAKKEDMQEVGA
jgi:uncharacterized membrane protein